MPDLFRELPRDTNQAREIGEYALDFLREGRPSEAVRERTKLFHTDAALCGLSALALGTNAPTILEAEAREYPDPYGATLLRGGPPVKAEKAVAANGAAVREWDANGTNFGYRPERGWTAGEFGHNDYYPVVLAACQEEGLDGQIALKGMVLLDEIRGRLAEVFSLKSYKLDHVVHGAIASAAVYGALRGATPEEIESGIGLFVAHHVPWRAIRAGKQLSDSKGASAAISAEAAVLGMRRAMRGFVGPADVFRNPEAAFRQFVQTTGDSPFDLSLALEGDDFAIMGMHLKLGLYEHQSAGAIQAVCEALARHPELRRPGGVRSVTVRAYEPAFGIIGDPAKRDPRTRQSADHSMVYIIARILVDAMAADLPETATPADVWDATMLMPEDYGEEALFDPQTRGLMEEIHFEHGGPEYDAAYPDGIPTSVVIEGERERLDSGLVMYPYGHARDRSGQMPRLLRAKWERLAGLCEGHVSRLLEKLDRLESLDAQGLRDLHEA